jgi:hypothetical protein
MNDNRYKAKGATHSMGMGAMFYVKKLVSATINMDGQAAKATHKPRWPPVTLPPLWAAAVASPDGWLALSTPCPRPRQAK